MSESSGPLTPPQWDTLIGLLQALSPAQRRWVSGFVAGFCARDEAPAAAAVEAPAAPASAAGLTLLYGSQTGNAEQLARRFHERLVAAGHPARLESTADYKPGRLPREQRLLIVVSTHGEGEPPDTALGFHQFLHGPRAPRLEQLRYAVLALGDSSYEHFCKTGLDIDQRLTALGAEPLVERVDCDADYEASAEAWFEQVLARLEQSAAGATPAVPSASAAVVSAYSRKNPFPAQLLENLPLTGPGSSKDVRHIVLSLAGSGLSHVPGDALGVLPGNPPALVEALLERLGLDPAAEVTGPTGSATPLARALRQDYEITTVSRSFLEQYAALAEAETLRGLLRPDQRGALRDWLRERQILDVLREYPVPGLAPQAFVDLLRRLPPRLYSIASSALADPDEVHLTVGVVRYEALGRERQGVASTFLADRLAVGDTVPVYVHENPNFRLPADPATPIIMIGPGTGVAPFRAFLAEREATGAAGRNWLFFGDRQFEHDFLYQREWLEYRRKGLLTRIDVAFSRDGADKVYVQHRILEQAREIHAWLEEGAHVYVCGDAARMASDVHAALREVLVRIGGQSPDQAQEALQALQAQRRYQRDVY